MQNKYLKFLLLALLVAIVVPQVALAAWWNPFSWGIWNSIFHFQRTAQQQTQQQNKAPVVGGDKDAYGCIGSAGYNWCDAKQKCLRTWEEACEISSDIYPIFSNLKFGAPVQKTVMNLSGYEIIATGKINSNTDAQEFFNYYDKKLKDLGWSVDNSVAADGILGSQTGYKKGDGHIILNYSIKPGKITSGANEPLQWTCPCDVTYSIFTTSISANKSLQLSEEEILGAVEKLENLELKKNKQGLYESSMKEFSVKGYGITINSITRGDVNKDGLEDAFVFITNCGASCGSTFIAVINKDKSVPDAFLINDPEEGIVTAGATQSEIKKITIKNGIIAINANVANADGSLLPVLINYELIGKKLIKVK